MAAYSATDDRARRWSGVLGVLVLAIVLTMMVLVGLMLFLLRRTLGAILPWLLSLVHGSVIVLGLLLLLGRNPFARLATTHAPVFRSPLLTSFTHGLLLCPMTLPCVAPLVVLPLLLVPAQRHLTRWLAGTASWLGAEVLPSV